MMWFKINQRSSVPLYKQIKDNIKNLIYKKEINDGETLPSIRQLADDIRVNPNTVSKAYKELEGEGIILARQGIGYLVIAKPKNIKSILIEDSKNELNKIIIRLKNSGVDYDEFKEVIEELWKKK
jgi:GntR family transcriptional regulator